MAFPRPLSARGWELGSSQTWGIRATIAAKVSPAGRRARLSGPPLPAKSLSVYSGLVARRILGLVSAFVLRHGAPVLPAPAGWAATAVGCQVFGIADAAAGSGHQCTSHSGQRLIQVDSVSTLRHAGPCWEQMPSPRESRSDSAR